MLALCFTILIDSIERFASPQPVTRPVLVLITGGAGLVANLVGLFLFHGNYPPIHLLGLNTNAMYLLEHGHGHGGHSHGGHSHGGHSHADHHHNESHSHDHGHHHDVESVKSHGHGHEEGNLNMRGVKYFNKSVPLFITY